MEVGIVALFLLAFLLSGGDKASGDIQINDSDNVTIQYNEAAPAVSQPPQQ